MEINIFLIRVLPGPEAYYTGRRLYYSKDEKSNFFISAGDIEPRKS